MAPVDPSKDPVSQADNRPRLPIAGGGEVAVNDAVLALRELRDIQERDPQLFGRLADLADGRPAGLTPDQIQSVRGRMLLDEVTQVPYPDVLAVLRAARRDTADGVVLVNPLLIRTPADRALVEEAEQYWDRYHAPLMDIFNRRRAVPRSWVERESDSDSPPVGIGRR